MVYIPSFRSLRVIVWSFWIANDIVLYAFSEIVSVPGVVATSVFPFFTDTPSNVTSSGARTTTVYCSLFVDTVLGSVTTFVIAKLPLTSSYVFVKSNITGRSSTVAYAEFAAFVFVYTVIVFSPFFSVSTFTFTLYSVSSYVTPSALCSSSGMSSATV